jgi:hypothetical protein
MALDANAIIRLDLLGPGIRTRILNASTKGMLLVMPDARPVGTRIHVSVELDNPPREIKVSGIIVHCNAAENVDPRFSARVGILITESHEDWANLCAELAKRTP